MAQQHSHWHVTSVRRKCISECERVRACVLFSPLIVMHVALHAFAGASGEAFVSICIYLHLDSDPEAPTVRWVGLACCAPHCECPCGRSTIRWDRVNVLVAESERSTTESNAAQWAHIAFVFTDYPPHYGTNRRRSAVAWRNRLRAWRAVAVGTCECVDVNTTVCCAVVCC